MSEPDAVQCPTCGTTLQQQPSDDNPSSERAKQVAARVSTSGTSVGAPAANKPLPGVVAVALPTEGRDILDHDFPVKSR